MSLEDRIRAKYERCCVRNGNDLSTINMLVSLADLRSLVAERDAARKALSLKEAELTAARGELDRLNGPAVLEVLSQPCFEFINLAKLWRDTGTAIEQRAEAEHGFFLQAMLPFAIEHGAAWRAAFFKNEIEPRLTKARRALSPTPAAGGAARQVKPCRCPGVADGADHVASCPFSKEME